MSPALKTNPVSRLVLRSLLLLVTLFPLLSVAAIDEYEFSSDAEQARFRKLTDEMRCPKCLNASLAGSDAPIAADLRAEIYDQIQEGRSDEEITDFMRTRYGDFILYRPPFSPSTALLWLTPGILLLAGFIILRRVMTASRENMTGELSPEEKARLAEILDQESRS